MKITNHAKLRFNQRTNITNQQYALSQALSNGYKLRNFIEPFYTFLNTRQLNGGHYSLRVYDNNIYVYDNERKKLVTIYPIPDEYLPIEQFLVTKDNINSCIIIVTTPDNTKQYISEDGDFTDDIAKATLFRTEQKANNYIKNNKNIDTLIKHKYKFDIMPL